MPLPDFDVDDDWDEVDRLRAEDRARAHALNSWCPECHYRGGHARGCPNEPDPVKESENMNENEQSGEGAIAAAAPGALTPVADAVSAALATVTQQTNTILQLAERGRELHTRYANVAFDVRTTKGMDEAKKARMILREEVRYPMQKLRDERSKLLGTMQRQANASADALISEVERYEAPIHEQIQAEETRKENERKDREEAERRRVEGHTQALSAIAQHVIDASGDDSAGIQAHIDGLGKMIVDESWEEFQGQAQQAKDRALQQLNGMLAAAKIEEAELEEARRTQAALRQQQQELARQQAEFAERERLFNEREARQREEAEALERARRERAEAVQRRIDGIKFAGEPLEGRTGESLRSIRRTLESLTLTAELLDDRVAEAEREQEARLVLVDRAIAEADEREHEEERQRRAAEVEERIQAIRRMGPRVDETADELRARIKTVEALELNAADYDDRYEEAGRVWSDVLADLMPALVEAAQREEQAAREAEEQRQREAEAAAARERHARIVAAAPRLYELLIRTYDEADEGEGVTRELRAEIEAIQAEIEGDDHA